MKKNNESNSKPETDKGPVNLSWMQKIRQFNIREFYSQRRKLVNIVAIAAVVLVAFSWGAFTFTSQPQFCRTCHPMRQNLPIKGPMGQVWDNWSKSVHAEVNCVECHVEPGLPKQLLHKVVALKEVYLLITDSYEKPIKAKELLPVDESCERCHSLKRKYSPSGDLIIPHAKHVEEVKLTCVACHPRVVHNPPGKTKPSMELCLTCHNGKKTYKGKMVPYACGTCHTKKAIPSSHEAANWFRAHGALSKTQNCEKCHGWRPDWCKQCHQKKPLSHATLWRTNHRNAVSVNGRAGCNACHSIDFCVRCHGQSI